MSDSPRQLSSSAERILTERAASGDNAAVESLYDAYEQRLYGYCHRICRNPEDAADATQEAFCNVIQRLPGLDTANLNFAAYMFTAARNACMDIIKQRGRAEVTDEVPEDPFAVGPLETDPERSLLTGDQQRAAREANDRLPESQRTALALREVSELSYDEIALTMDMNSNAVAQLISRARMNFHKQLRAGAVVVAPGDEAGERALTLTSARIDGKITDEDLDWLQSHLLENESSRINAEAMQESAVLYRAIGPVAILVSLKGATMAKAADLGLMSGSQGRSPSDQGGSGTANGGSAGSATSSTAATAVLVSNPFEFDSDDQHRSKSNKRRAAMVTGAALLVLLIAVGVAGGTGSTDQQTLEPAAEVSEPSAPVSQAQAPEKAERSSSKKPKEQSEPQNSKAVEAPALANGNSSGGKPSKEKKSSSKDETASGKSEPAPDAPVTSEPPPSTPPPAEVPPDSSPPTPNPPTVPGGPGSICGVPSCMNPAPPVP